MTRDSKRIKTFYQWAKEFFLVKVTPYLIPNQDVDLGQEIYNDPYSKISICTTCMGRTMHLKKTYIKNIEDNLSYPNIEFVLLNFGSNDSMDAWVREHLKEYINRGIVMYYHTQEPRKFHASKAKNLSHRLSSGEILVNLDADNYLGKDFAFFTNYLFQRKKNIFLHFSGRGFRYYDTCGRIAVKREDFFKVGGYNEAFKSMAYQDIDFIKRLEVTELRSIRVDHINFLRTIKHGSDLRVANVDEDDLDSMRQHNIQIAHQELMKGKYRVNLNGFQPYEVRKNFSDVKRVL